MVILGLTGPTGAGKGFISQVLAEKGFAVLNADRVAHDVTASGTPCTAAIARAFGNDVLRPDGSLNRKALASIVFSDTEKLNTLNALSHPPILAQIQKEMAAFAAAGFPAAVLDAPALFESGADKSCDYVAAVTADADTRLARIMKRDGLDESRAIQRIRAQPDDAFYTARADFVLKNDDENDHTLEQAVDAMAKALLTKAGRTEERPCTKS